MSVVIGVSTETVARERRIPLIPEVAKRNSTSRFFPTSQN